MSSSFDSEVYRQRRKNEFLMPDLSAFKAAVQSNGSFDFSEQNGGWACAFYDDQGRQCFTWSQRKDLCLWRAIVAYNKRRFEALRRKFGTDKASIGYYHYARQKSCERCGQSMLSNDKGDFWCANLTCPY